MIKNVFDFQNVRCLTPVVLCKKINKVDESQFSRLFYLRSYYNRYLEIPGF